MTEIYRDVTDKVIALNVTGATATTAKFVRKVLAPVDQLNPTIYPAIITETVAVVTDNTVTVPYSISRIDGDFDLVWTYVISAVTYTRTETNTIVTPYFTTTELINHDADMAALSAAQVVKLERLVRGVVNSFVGQNFGYEEGILIAYGTGDRLLNTTKKVLGITSIAQADYPGVIFDAVYRPINQGFSIESVGIEYESSIKVPAYEESPYSHYAPVGNVFRNNIAYVINGAFGFQSIPYDVNLAALTLAEEFSCDESLWRERYIKSIKGEGFDIEFRSDAFTGTGSVTADQLLGKFVVNKLAII